MEKKAKKERKVKVTTVGEAKRELASMKDTGDNYVWGTSVQEGSRQELQATLSAMDDDDSFVWGT